MSRGLIAGSGSSNFYVMRLTVTGLSGGSAVFTTGKLQSGEVGFQRTGIAIGPELDWRSGIGSWKPISLTVLSGLGELLSGAGDLHFQQLLDLLEWEVVDSKYVPQLLNNAVSAELEIVSTPGAVTPTTGFQTVLDGVVSNLSQEDYNGLTLHLAPKRELWINKRATLEFGYEGTGNKNYDTGTYGAFNESVRGEPVPIVYGSVPYAKGVAVRTTTTLSAASHHGLTLCFSDNRFATYKSGTSPQLYIPGAHREPIELASDDWFGGTDPQYQWCDGPTNETIGGAVGAPDGSFVGFTGQGDTGIVGASLARGGFLLTKRRYTPDRAADYDNPVGGWGLWLNGVTNYTWTHAKASGGQEVGLLVSFAPDGSLPGDFTVAFLQLDLESLTIGIPGSDWDVTARNFRGATSDYAGASENNPNYGPGEPALTANTRWDNVQPSGTEDEFQFGWYDRPDFSTTSDGASFRVYTTDRSDLSQSHIMRLWDAQLEVWTEVPWNEYEDRIYGSMTGVLDATYRYHSSNFLKNPAEIAAHFIKEVLGGSINTTDFFDQSSALNADGIKLAFQLSGDESGEEVLSKIADQGMCWIFPEDDGRERIIYRPAMYPTLETTIVRPADIIKGSFRWSLSPRDDVHRSVVVKYKWSDLHGRFLADKIIGPTGNSVETSLLSDAAVYTAFADSINVLHDRPLVVEADYIQDDATADRLCKWLMLLHGRRRQVVEFDLPMTGCGLVAGTLFYIDAPQIRPHCAGNAFGFYHTSNQFYSRATSYVPSGDTTNKGLSAAHHHDLLIVEGGAYAGRYEMYWDGTGFELQDAIWTSVGTDLQIDESWRVLPAFDCLASQIVWDAKSGPRVHIRAVEHPVFLPRTNDL